MKVTKESINQEVAKFVNLYHKMTAPLVENIKKGDFVLNKLNEAKRIETRPQKLAWLNKQIKRVSNVKQSYVNQLKHVKNQMKF